MTCPPCGGDPPNPIRPVCCKLDADDGPEGVDGEARPIKSRGLPKGPSEEEKRAHRVTHYPFRSWCPVCVAGRAKNYPHLRGNPKEEREFPEISFDYCFPRKETGGDSVSILVGKERKTKMMIAHVVPMKGSGVQWLADQLVRDIRKLGIHGKVILKCDQEVSILDVMECAGLVVSMAMVRT